MKTKMSYKSKKIAIITAIILVLIGGISVGTYFYIKGNTETKATTGDNSTINNELVAKNNVSEESNNETSEEANTTVPSTNNETNSTASNTVNNSSNNVSNNTSVTNNNASNNNGNNSEGSSSEELPNEEYVQTDYIETGKQILVSESLKVGWINASLIRDNVSTKIDVVKPTLELNKTAEINSVNAEDNSVQKGSKITYKITVTNTSKDVDATNVTITDKVPTGTILDESTAISDEGKEENGKITWNVNVPSNSSKTVSFTVTVNAEDGEIKNTAVVDGKETPETVNPVIESNKTYSSEDDIIRNGSIISYTITVTNKSNIDAITSVRDTVPEGTTLEKVLTDGASVNENVITWNNVTLEAGETKTFTFDVKVDNYDGENRVIKNVAVVGDKETTETETEVHYPVITSTKTTDKGSVEAGDKLTYTITLTNSGIVDGNVKVKDSAPIGTMFDKENGVTVSNDENVYAEEKLNNGIDVTVPAGEEVKVSFTVIVNEGITGSIKNTAIVDDGTPTDEENPSVETPVITTNKEVSAKTATVGETLTYTITVENTGEVAGTAIVKDEVPEGTTFKEGSNVVVSNDSKVYTEQNLKDGITVNVPANDKVTVTFEVAVNNMENGTIIENTAKVNEKDTPKAETTYQEAVFEAEKTANKGSVSVGEELEYTIKVTNTGSIAGTAIVKDDAPEGTKFKENTTVTVSNTEKTYTTAELIQGIPVELEVGEEAEVKFTVVVEESAEGAIENKATVNDEETGDKEEPEAKTPVITINKEVNAETATAGETLTYTITVENTGEVAGTAIVKDEVPEGTTFKEGSNVVVSNDSKVYTEQNLKDGITVNVPANGEVTVTFEVTVSNLADETKITNTALVNDKETPKAETTYQEAVFEAEKTANKGSVSVGEELEYTIKVTNTGSIAGTAIVKDDAPEGTKFKENTTVTVSNTEKTYTTAELIQGIPVELEVGEEAEVKFTVVVEESAEGAIENKATVNDEETGDKEEPEAKTPVITINKEVNAETATAGETLTYTITVENTGEVAGTAIVKDEVPEGTTFKEGSNVVVSNDSKVYTEQNLKDGITVNVPANDKVTVIFEVTVNNMENGTVIENTAKVNGKDTPKAETTYQEAVFEAEKTANKGSVSVGEELEYTIKVTNTGSIAGTAIVKDDAPEGTKFKENTTVTVSNTEKTYTTAELIQGIPVELEVGEKAEVKFTVVVEESAEGAIENKATVNDEETGDKEEPETKTPVITINKEVNAETATVGETLTYTITVENTGEVAGTAIVKDEEPEGTTFKEGSNVVVSNDSKVYTEQNLKDGITANVPANGEVTVTFEVTVSNLADETKITNTALVNDKETPKAETTYQEAVFEAEKTANKGSVSVGEELEYTIKVTNTGSIAGTAIVKDDAPEGTKFKENTTVTVSNTEKTYTTAELIQGIPVELEVGEEAEVKFTVVVEESAEGAIENKATVNDEETGDKEEPEAKTPVITINKEVNAETATAGETLTYTITVENTGEVAGTAIVKDEEPEGTTFKEGSNVVVSNDSKVYTEQNLKDGITVNVPANDKVTVIFEVTVNNMENGTVIENTAKVNGKDTPKAETTYQEAVFEAEKTANKGSVSVGEELEYTIKVTNTGSIAGTAIVKDDAPEGTKFKENTTVTVSNTEKTYTTAELIQGIPVELEVGEKAEVKFTVVVEESAEGAIENKATVNDEETGDKEEPETKTPVITINKEVNAETATVGETLTYTITVENTGEVAGTAIVKDEEPEGTTFKEGSNVVVSNDSKVYTEQNLKDGITANVPANGEVTVTFEVTVSNLADETKITNTALVNDKETPETETTYQEAVFEAEKTANKGSVSVGEELEYTIKVTNTGSIAGTAIVKDDAPEGTKFKENTTVTVSNTEKTYTTAELIQGIPVELEVGEEAEVKFTVVVEESAEGTIENKATVNDEETGDKEEPEAKTPVITINKEVNAETATAGETLTYTITVENTGEVAGTAIVKDEVPEGTTFKEGSNVVVSNDSKVYTEQNLKDGITVNVPANDKVTVIFEVTVSNLTDEAKITNTAVVNDKETPKAETTYQEAVFEAEKTVNKGSASVGEELEYTIKVTNTGSIAGTAIIKDPIEKELDFKENSNVTVEKNNSVIGTYAEEDLTTNGINVELGVNETATVTFKVVVNEKAEGTIKNVATVNDKETGDEVDSSVEIPIITATKTNNTEGKKLQEGDEVLYTITVKNEGKVSGDVVVTDTIPEGLTYETYTPAAVGKEDTITEPTSENNTLTWNVMNLAKGENRIITITAIVDAVEGEKQITNSVKVNGNTTDTSTITVVEPTLEISKTAATILDTDDKGVEIPGQSKKEAEIGDTIVYTITVKNTSDVATTVEVSDPLTSEVTFNKFTDNSANATYSNGIVSYKGTLAGGNTLTIQFTVTVNELASNKIGKEILNIANVNGKTTTASTKIVKKVTLTTTSQTMNSLDLVLVLDVSTSMSNSGEIANLKTAANNLADRVFSSETNSTITMITYAGYLRSSKTYNYDDKNNIIKDIKDLGTYSGTNVYSALKETNSVVDKLLKKENAENRKRVVVFMTDGAPTFYTGGDNSVLARLITAPNNSASNDYYANNLRPEIIEQAETLKQKDVDVYAVGLGINNLLDNKYQYAEKEDTSIDQSMFKENEATYIRDGRKNIKVYRMTQKDYAKYLLNNISTSGKYIETSNLNSTFDDILSKQTTNKYIYKATDEKLTITIPETRTIIADQDGKAVTVQIGNGTPVKYTLRQLINGVNGLKYEAEKGFVWVIDTNILASDLYISYKVEGLAEDNQ